MGEGSFFTVSCKQKINTKSSTEAELVAVYDCMSHLLWLRNFLLAQGYVKAEKIVVLQDNQSAILLEQNGILSSTQRTKHLNSRYFYVKDRVDNHEIEIRWCPTDKIVADYLTKPLTGEKFHHFRMKIMNMKKLKLENLRPELPKYENLSQVDRGERAVKKLRKYAINDLRNILSDPRGARPKLKEWTRMDYNAARFKTTDGDGPLWKDVVARTTYDLTGGNNQIIEHIKIDKSVGAAVLNRKLPPGVTEIRTVLLYKDNSVGKHDEEVGTAAKEDLKVKKKLCWGCGPAGVGSGHSKLANRRGKVKKSKKVDG